ncbi:ArnT family glycosyltransferase [Tolumonas lignilytica]|uniref:ArnT family glycosyltransferase n=1 Tax=Tolumonas lignilytica TaxID=1283284 RepID=UPI000463037A|nr:glycosyltransferase family 39 protein [Tolumonas lignilytica]
MISDRFTLHGFDNDRLNLLFLLGVALLLLGAGLGLRDPWPADEPRFALIAKQMVDTGQWLFPFRGGEIYPDKPPMFMWGIAAIYWLTHSMRIAFLIPSLVAGLGCITLVYDMSRRLWGNSVAFRAGLLLLFTVQFTVQGKQAQIDELVTFFVTLGCYGFLRFLLTSGGWRWYYLGWFAAGLGIITKGVGILALFILIPAIYTHFQKIKAATKSDWLKAFSGPFIMLMACGLWLIPMLVAVKMHADPIYTAYRDNILFHQTVTRYANSWQHIKPFWYYLLNVIPPFWLPWSLLLPWIVLQCKNEIRNRNIPVIILVTYLILIIVFFSISPGKRGVYMTPATIPFAMLSALFLPNIINRKIPIRLMKGLSWLVPIVFIATGIVLLIKPNLNSHLAEISSPVPLALSLGISGILVNLILRKQRITALLSVLTLFWLHYGLWAYPLINDLRTPQGIMLKAESITQPNQEILLTNMREQFLLFANRDIYHFSYHQDKSSQVNAASVWIKSQPNRWVLGPKSNLKKCFDINKGILLGNRHNESWYLFSTDSVIDKPDCLHSSDIKIYHYTPKINSIK